MSDIYTNTSGGSDAYNAGAAHDSGFYDPDRHDNQIVAVYEDFGGARAARDALVDAGVPAAQIMVMSHTEGDLAPGATQVEDRGVGHQILTALTSLLTPAHEHDDYHHAVNQGHAMVVVTPTGNTDRRRVIQVLEHSHPLDFDAKLAEWRQAGYDQSGAPRSPDHAERRAGQREQPAEGAAAPSRVRSYIAERDPAKG